MMYNIPYIPNLRKEPLQRYLTAEQFSADIQAYLDGRPVAARQGTLRYRAAKFMHRHQLVYVLGEGTGQLPLGGGKVSTLNGLEQDSFKARGEPRARCFRWCWTILFRSTASVA
jgi:hypothetical protein